ncbi:hypothetical protein PRIPAC_79922 [Pristionchus pacificus]|uniref:Endo/exonuclease/phosphatase domain-containing protein n=1 Tax=Pristionchus pacificus TaxID=54126 RepID=A0A2A6C334_PRIPA|nr:hypothetical protein PRIPAC_79922 [Pristionchus pacificus]|eukprot:PDM72529.1 hypothetical protein PRIPAC_38963 [Pristionchus pacificus]
MLCKGSTDFSYYSSPLPLNVNDSLEGDVDIRENGRWRKREVSVYSPHRLRDSILVIRKKKGGPIEREYSFDSLCGMMIESREGSRFPLLIVFPRNIIRIGFKLEDSVELWKRRIERISGQSTVISRLTLSHTPFLPPFTTLGHTASILIIGCRLTIIDHKREEVLVTAIDESLWISFDDLRKNPDEYFSLESINAREILNYFRELREKMFLRFKMLPYKRTTRALSIPSSAVSSFYANCRSVRCKVPQITYLLSSFAYKLISLTETWLLETDSDALLIGGFPDYHSFRCDRALSVDSGRGGGVAFIVHNSLNPVLVSTFTASLLESCIIDLHLTYCTSLPFRKVRVIIVYRSPSSPSLAFTSFLAFISPLIPQDFPCIILGDFNYPSIDWSSMTSPNNEDIIDFACDHHLTQLVSFPTRLLSCLDLIFCNSDIVCNLAPSVPLSDHLSLIFDLRIPSPPSRTIAPSRMYRLANWDAINDHILCHDWTIALSSLDANSAYEYFVQFINRLLDQFVPLSKTTPHSRYPRSLKILYGKCKSLTRVAPNSISCMMMSKRFQKALYKFHCSLENRIVSLANPKSFYSLCNDRLKVPKSTPSGLIDSSGNILLTDNEKCLAFSSFFSSAFSVPQQSPLPLPSPNLIFDLPVISQTDILYAFRTLSPKINYHINSIPLIPPPDKKMFVKDLGVLFSPSLTFSDHINKVISKARSISNLMFKSFRSTSTLVYTKSFTTFILPHLEYGSIIWNPVHSVELTRSVEKVQRDFTRRLYARCKLPHVPYRQRLIDLNFMTLENRRVMIDLSFVHSIVHNRTLLDTSSLLCLSPLSRPLRNSHNLRISLPFLPSNSQTTVASRTISLWNSLPSTTVSSRIFSHHSLMSSLPSLMEPLHQLHSSTYEVDKRQPLMYPYKMHYQNGPISEYRKEFPSKNDRDDSSWKQSQSSVNLDVLKSPACSSDSSEGYDNEKTMIERERTIITENEWAMRVMQSNQMNDVLRWVEGYRIQVANLNTEIERLREHNTLLKDKAHDKIRWYEGEMKKMGLALGMVTSTLAQVLSHHAVFNWTSCFYEPPVAPAVDPSTVDVPAVLHAARGALNNPGLVTGKVAHDVTLELLKSIADEGTRWRLGASPQLLGMALGIENVQHLQTTPLLPLKESQSFGKGRGRGRSGYPIREKGSDPSQGKNQPQNNQ